MLCGRKIIAKVDAIMETQLLKKTK